MAGPAESGTISELSSGSAELAAAVVSHDILQETVAGLYGRGLARAKIARILVDHLCPTGRDRPLEQRLSQARSKLRRWERTKKFRDMVYNRAVVELDMSTPQILQGVSRKARQGRVDAARLALEVTGRHNPKGEQSPTQVAVVFTDVPRPGIHRTPDAPPMLESEVAETVREMESGSS